MSDQHPVNSTLFGDVLANAAKANATAVSLLGQAGLFQLATPVDHGALMSAYIPQLASFVANTTFSNRTEVGTAAKIAYQKDCGDAPTDKIRVTQTDVTCGSLSAPTPLW